MLSFFRFFSKNPDYQKLEKAIRSGATLVDVRTPSEFLDGSVKGAINVPLDRLPNELHSFPKQKCIVVFCRSGNRSSQAKTILKRNGFTQVINGGSWSSVNQCLKG